MRFIPCNIHLQEGDIITSKKGILQKSAISEQSYIVKKLKFISNNHFEVIGEKIEVADVKEVNGRASSQD